MPLRLTLHLQCGRVHVEGNHDFALTSHPRGRPPVENGPSQSWIMIILVRLLPGLEPKKAAIVITRSRLNVVERGCLGAPTYRYA